MYLSETIAVFKKFNYSQCLLREILPGSQGCREDPQRQELSHFPHHIVFSQVFPVLFAKFIFLQIFLLDVQTRITDVFQWFTQKYSDKIKLTH